MSNKELLRRIRIIALIISLLGMVLILRQFNIVFLRKQFELPMYSREVVIFLIAGVMSAYFFNLFYKFLANVGTETFAVFKGMYAEWITATPLSKLMMVSSILSLLYLINILLTWFLNLVGSVSV